MKHHRAILAIFFALLSFFSARNVIALVNPVSSGSSVLVREDEGQSTQTERGDDEVMTEGRTSDDQRVMPPPALSQPLTSTPADNGSAAGTNVLPSRPIADDTQSSVQAPAQTPAVSTSFPWPWVITRATGIASYLLLVLLTITGTLLTTGTLYRLFAPDVAWSVHRALATALLASVVIHIGALLFDHYIGLHLRELLIPFASHYQPLLVAFGIIGFYLLLIVLSSSLYTLAAHPKFWRTLHALAFPMIILIFFHAILLGTDRHQPWVVWMYWTTSILVLASVGYRLLWKYKNPSFVRQTPPRRKQRRVDVFRVSPRERLAP